MSNKLHPLDGALKRIERAEKHLQEVVTEIESYRRDNYDRMFIEFDKATDNITVGVTGPPLIPMCISLAISDCVHNFRSALDYVVYELARYDSGGKIQSGTQFPIENTRSEFIGQRKRRLKGLSNSHVDAIEAYQPYKGVKWTKTLQTISNPDKHRHLIELGGSFEHDMILTGGAPGSFAGLPGKVFHGIGGDGCDVYVERKHALDIAFDDGLRVAETLQIMNREVRTTIDAFKPEFK